MSMTDTRYTIHVLLENRISITHPIYLIIDSLDDDLRTNTVFHNYIPYANHEVNERFQAVCEDIDNQVRKVVRL